MLRSFLTELTENTLINDVDHFLFTGTLTTFIHSLEENGLDTLDKFLVSHRLVECGELYLTEAVFQLVVAVEHRIIVLFHYRFNGNVVDYRQSIVDGLKQSYRPYEDNEHFLKGKVIYAKHATKNFAHKDKFYVQYDVFTIDRPENRLIKSTLKYLRNITSSARSKNKLDSLIANFDGVEYSQNYKQDFAASVLDRSMSGYGNALRWAEIFLLSRYVTVTSGRNVAYAVIFPSGELFDNYTAYSLSRMLDNQRFKIELQKKRYPRLNRPMPRDSAQALAVMTSRADGLRVVIDSKWQGLSSSDENMGILQTDIYDLYNLLEMYKSQSVCYIYPSTPQTREDNREICFKNEDGILGRVYFVDIGDMEASLAVVLEHIFGQKIEDSERRRAAGAAV